MVLQCWWAGGTEFKVHPLQHIQNWQGATGECTHTHTHTHMQWHTHMHTHTLAHTHSHSHSHKYIQLACYILWPILHFSSTHSCITWPFSLHPPPHTLAGELWYVGEPFGASCQSQSLRPRLSQHVPDDLSPLHDGSPHPGLSIKELPRLPLHEGEEEKWEHYTTGCSQRC